MTTSREGGREDRVLAEVLTQQVLQVHTLEAPASSGEGRRSMLNLRKAPLSTLPMYFVHCEHKEGS
jgi:hypothetical protein